MSPLNKPLKNVLCIDDDDEYNFLAEEAFADSLLDCSLKFQLYATDALEYLSACEQRGEPFPDLILLDINMPLMNGWEFLREYEKRNYHKQYDTLIIMISSSVFQEDKEKIQEFQKVQDFVDKPLTGDNVLHIYNRYFSAE